MSPNSLAYVLTGLGEHDRAIERAYDERSGAIFGVSGSFRFVPLRGHPMCTALLRRINLA